MALRPRIEARIRFLGIGAMLLCGTGVGVVLFVILIRVPALAQTKLELLFGTLQGVAVGLLFAIAALLINLTVMVRRAAVQGTASRVNEG